MLDLTFIRQNLDLVRQKMRERGNPHTIDAFEQLDAQRPFLEEAARDS